MAESSLRLVKDGKPTEPLRFRFTIAQLERFGPRQTKYHCYDTKAANLAVLVTPTNHKAFYYVRRYDGRYRRMKIGNIDTTTIEQARRQAAKLDGIAADGHNPFEQRRQHRGELTLRELWDTYVENHSQAHCTAKTRTAESSLWKLTLAKLGSRKLSAIKPSHVAAMHANVGKTRSKTSANRAVQLLRRLLNYAAKYHGHEGANPTQHITLFREQTRERYLSADELPRFIAALDHEDQIFRDFFRLALLTAARRSNLQAMRWADVDLQRKIWTIASEESKNQTAMVVPLVPAAMDILQRRKDANDQGDDPSEYVFPAQRRRLRPHIGQPLKPWNRICERAGLRGLRIHDLRRSMGAWQAAGGASLIIIGRSLGHLDARSTQVYARIDSDPVRASMEAAAAAMFGTAKPTPKRTKRKGTKGKEGAQP